MDIFGRQYEITVDGFSVDQLRCGFTVKRTLSKHANEAELAIYNLAEASRNRIHKAVGVSVVIKAGYKTTGMSVIFAGEMRAAYSRPERDGSWVTIVRAGDGDKGAQKSKTSKGLRPGVSLTRVASDLAADLGVGIGNAASAFLSGDIEGIGDAFTSGFSAFGSPMEQLDKIARSTGREVSVQNGELQVLTRGKALTGITAIVLSASTGLEGTPEIDAHGLMTCRARLVPGLFPGRAVLVESAQQGGRNLKGRRFSVAGLWRINEVQYVGDTHGSDWNAEIKAQEVAK